MTTTPKQADNKKAGDDVIDVETTAGTSLPASSLPASQGTY